MKYAQNSSTLTRLTNRSCQPPPPPPAVRPITHKLNGCTLNIIIRAGIKTACSTAESHRRLDKYSVFDNVSGLSGQVIRLDCVTWTIHRYAIYLVVRIPILKWTNQSNALHERKKKKKKIERKPKTNVKLARPRTAHYTRVYFDQRHRHSFRSRRSVDLIDTKPQLICFVGSYRSVHCLNVV